MCEGEVRRMRYDIGTDDNLTLEADGRRLDVGRERVREIETHATGKLSEPASLGVLRSSAAAL